MTYSTSPLVSGPGLERPVLDVTHLGHVSVPSSLPLSAAARTMSARHVHAALVCDEGGTPLGWVTTRGMLHNLPREWDGATVGDAITEPVTTVAPDATVRDALNAFLASGASHILVMSPADATITGVIAESDLLVLLTDGPEPAPQSGSSSP